MLIAWRFGSCFGDIIQIIDLNLLSKSSNILNMANEILSLLQANKDLTKYSIQEATTHLYKSFEFCKISASFE